MQKLAENTKKNIGHDDIVLSGVGEGKCLYSFFKKPLFHHFWALLLLDRLTHIDEVLGH